MHQLASFIAVSSIVLAGGCRASQAPTEKSSEPLEAPLKAPAPSGAATDAPLVPSVGDALVPVPQAFSGLSLERMYKGLRKPLGLEFFVDDPLKRLFVVEQTGTVRALADGKVDSVPLLDVKSLLSRKHSEQGLLGLAFHPEFKDNGLLYVNYTGRGGETQVVQYTSTTAAGAKVDPKSSKVLLTLKQPWPNHNGGYLEFGPDGLLYVGTGDGGAADDPKRASQNSDNRLGKMLRIDVDTGGVSIVQTGLRNPWRYTFDRATGDLYIADVGQNKWEEVNVVAPTDIDGANFGWSVWEGKHCFRKKGCSDEGMVMPAIEFDHTTGCSITGGIVYRGLAIPELAGAYFYSDYCTAILRSFRWKSGQVSDHWDWKDTLDPKSRLAEVSAFAEDADGEMYLLSSGGGIYKLVSKNP